MPSFDPQDRARLYHYASDLRIWFQEWLLEPVRKATGGIIPAAPDLRGSDYDDKFRILLSPASFLPALRRCRIESWLRDINVAVAFTDIDDFKALNTRYTESVVDRDLLPKIMRTIEARVYSHGWAYRFGGDEYLLLLPNMDLKVAGEFLQSLQERLGSLEFQGIHERIAVSIGLCVVTPDSFLTDREVQEKANRPMQHAKQVSKNCIATFKGEFFGDEDLYVMNRQGHKEP